MGLFDHLYNLDWTSRYPLEYYYNDGRHVIFDKYDIDMFGNIYNKTTRIQLSYYRSNGYNMVTIYDHSNKKCGLRVSRASVSTFHGKPPSVEHSAEHIDCNNKDNDIVCELTWIDPSGQTKNRICPGEKLNSYIIIRDDIEMTRKEWVRYLSNQKNSHGREYTETMIKHYATRKQYGFSYKVYDDLPGETWYKVRNSENRQGHWEISDKNRIARVSKHARNVVDATRFGFTNDHPIMGINGKDRMIHDVAFEAYYPDAYAAKKPEEMILHKHDDKLDFRPHTLYIGDKTMNSLDAYNNGRHDGTKTARMKCCSYINGIFEKLHESQEDAAKYLKLHGYPRARGSKISMVLSLLYKENKVISRYGRTWSHQT